MGKEHILVGLEIGTSKICVVVGEADPVGPIRILGVGQAASRGVRKGEIIDFETAHKCVREALNEAEERSDVTIRSVFLALTGGHIESLNSRGEITLPEEREEIDENDLEDIEISARDVNIPKTNAFIHSVLQHFYIDGQEGVVNPVGMLGRKLQGDYHIIHGVSNRIKNTIRCVREIGIEVEDVVFSGLASAAVVLSSQQKDLGALVIDIGGGTTDYVLYVDGAVKQSGVLAIGGDHITNDISMGLRIPMARAERLKVEQGNVSPDGAEGEPIIQMQDERGFAGRDIDRDTLNLIIRCRMEEVFGLIRKRLDEAPYLRMLGAGVFLTGGCSQLKGIRELAQEMFGVPVHGAYPSPDGPKSAAENPQLSSAVGLLRYAQAKIGKTPEKAGFISKIRKIFSRR